MTVAQLIDELGKWPPDALVVICSDTEMGDWDEVSTVSAFDHVFAPKFKDAAEIS